jgi:hypothetical protein
MISRGANRDQRSLKRTAGRATYLSISRLDVLRRGIGRAASARSGQSVRRRTARADPCPLCDGYGCGDASQRTWRSAIAPGELQGSALKRVIKCGH